LYGAILFLEDVNEPPYRLDRMLTQLKLAGALQGLSGVILGHFIGSDSGDTNKWMENIVLDALGDADIPIISGFPHGHAMPNITLPHGAVIRLTTDPPTLRVVAGIDVS
jgi:muramoyltetrapeptide carboxypeptidase